MITSTGSAELHLVIQAVVSLHKYSRFDKLKASSDSWNGRLSIDGCGCKLGDLPEAKDGSRTERFYRR